MDQHGQGAGAVVTLTNCGNPGEEGRGTCLGNCSLHPRAPSTPFDQRCADALADEVAVLVRRRVIDARSPAADALLDYRDPPSSPRADRLAEIERQLTESTAREQADEFSLLKEGGKWLAAARSWLQHRRTTKGVHGDQIKWGDASAIFAISARDVEELAAHVAAAAINEQGDMRPTLEHLRKARFEAQANAAIATARADRAERRVDIGRQMATVIYNVAQTGEWERAKQPLIELREAWDAAGKRCNGDHAEPPCADSQCWRR